MKTFNLDEAIEILERTPDVLESLLKGLNPNWISINEGPDSWSAFDVVGHLIHGERTDWMPRLQLILKDNDSEFEPFDRFAQFELSKGKNLDQLLSDFRVLRKQNLEKLKSLKLTFKDFNKTAIHPALGKVTLSELLATWVVHDLNHLAQISRVMAKRYLDEVGPWKAYLGILNP